MKSFIPSSTTNNYRAGFPNPYSPTAAMAFINGTPQATTLDPFINDTSVNVAPPLFSSSNNSIINFSSDIISNGITRSPITESISSAHTGTNRDYYQVVQNTYVEGVLTL